MALDQILVNRQETSVQAAAQRLILNLIIFLEIEIVHHRLRLKQDALLLVSTKENLPVLNDLQFQQQRCLVQDHYIDTFRFQPLREFAEKVHLVIEKLVGFDLIHQKDGDIDITEMPKQGSTCKGTREIGSVDGILREELVKLSLLLE